MQLILAIHPITEIRFGENTRLDGTVLVTAKDELRRLASQVPGIESVDFEIVHPGESCRAGPIFDIVEPRAKAPDGSPDWPGILGASQTAGSGTTHVLNGAAVTFTRGIAQRIARCDRFCLGTERRGRIRFALRKAYSLN
jgi:sarcosine reductase